MSRNRLVLASSAMLVAVTVFMALFAPWISPHDPDYVAIEKKLQSPDREHLLGTDHLGRDVLSRLIHGARVSLGTTFAAMGAILLIGLLVGAASGYAGGWVDSGLMRICDVFLAFPTLILVIVMVGTLGPGVFNMILAIALSHWAWYGRIVRGLVLGLKHREFVLAARVAGTSRTGIVVRHILPSVIAQLAILATLDLGHIMLHVSGLSFLGLGIQPPTSEWGAMINDARHFVRGHPELMTYPGLMIFFIITAFNLLGDALRDSLDPGLREGGF